MVFIGVSSAAILPATNLSRSDEVVEVRKTEMRCLNCVALRIDDLHSLMADGFAVRDQSYSKAVIKELCGVVRQHA